LQSGGVAVRCSVVQCVRDAVRVWWGPVRGSALSASLHVCCSVLQCVAVCCSVLQCVAHMNETCHT